MMKYKEGDIVVVREDLNINDQYADEAGEFFDIALQDMVDMAGLKMEILRVHPDVCKYNLKLIDSLGANYYPPNVRDNMYTEIRYWVDDMFEGRGDIEEETVFEDTPEMDAFLRTIC